MYLLFSKVASACRRFFIKSKPPTWVSHRNNGKDVAVIFVHGFSGSAISTWSSYVPLLLLDHRINSWDVFEIGYPSRLRIDIPNYWESDPDLYTLAAEFRTIVGLPPLKRYKKLAILAHSMGGLVIQRAILDDEELSARLSHVFLFGTPSGGLEKASMFAALKGQIRDMKAGGVFVTTLRAQWKEKYACATPFRFYAIAGDMDQFVGQISSLAVFPPNVQRVIPGNHLEIVRPKALKDVGVAIVTTELAGGTRMSTFVDGARLAVERGEFQVAISALLPRVAEIDQNALGLLALALESENRASEALELLEKHANKSYTDAMGILAGRLKRRWLVNRIAADHSRAHELYRNALELAMQKQDSHQIFYHAINVAFLDLMAAPPSSAIPSEAQEMAALAASHCLYVSSNYWSLATHAEASLILNDLEIACTHYVDAIHLAPLPRDIDSTYSQAILVAARVFGSEGAKRIERAFGYLPCDHKTEI